MLTAASTASRLTRSATATLQRLKEALQHALRRRVRGVLRPRVGYRCRCLTSVVSVADRQARLQDWDQAALGRATVLVAGAGGVGGEVAEGLARKGVGTVVLVDPDTVSPTDLNRQKFTTRDLYQPKATSLARLLSTQACLGTTLKPAVGLIQDVDLAVLHPAVVVCCVDQKVSDTRLWLARTCRHLRIPVVFTAVSTDADWGYTLIQDANPTSACWNCVFKSEYDTPADAQAAARCPGTPAAIDVLKLVAAWTLYAVDSLIMQRPRDWNYRSQSLSQRAFGSTLLAPQRAGCAVCSPPRTPTVEELSCPRIATT